MSILLPGAAGFIGFQLLERGERVLGIDNLNAYYDVRLKEARVMKRCAEACRWAASDAGVSNTAQYPRRNARHDRGARYCPRIRPGPHALQLPSRGSARCAYWSPKEVLKVFFNRWWKSS